MKKILAASLIFLLLPLGASANHATAFEEGLSEEPASLGTMTIKSFTWMPEIFTDGENKLLKINVDFHYEGDFITLGQDYAFNIHCRMNRLKRRGGYKYLFEEERDLSILDEEAMEIEGPKDFSVPFTFTFYPHEFEAVKKRGVTCDVSPSGDYGKGGSGSYIKTKFPEKMKTYGIRVRPKNNVWKVQ
ncbi:MAG: hypothetical protein AAB588_03245 [Patescibacteria group bacterium]